MVDYSKWQNIEISDDEDDTHANIDTPTLFRWRHQIRLERMKNHEKEVENFEKKKIDHDKKMSEANEKLSEAQLNNSGNLVALQEALKQLEKEGEDLKQMEEELKKKEKNTPWNVDTISKPGFSKTMINTKSRPADENLTKKEKENRKEKFIKEHEKELKHYGMLRRFDDSRTYLKAHDYLICEDVADYLATWCLNLEMEQKRDSRKHVVHQMVCMKDLLDFAKELNCDPRACLDIFFAIIQKLEPEKQARFEEQQRHFNEDIVKLGEAIKGEMGMDDEGQ